MEEIEGLLVMQTLAQTYAEIAALRMKRVRSGVVNTRDYLGGIKEIFEEVVVGYRREIEELGSEGLTVLSHNGKTVMVLLSANAGLYGDIMRKLFDKFFIDLEQGFDDGREIEVTVVGRLGRAVFLSRGGGKPFTYFDLPDNKDTLSDTTKIVEHLVQYEAIRMYHGQFETILSQKPVTTVIAAVKDLPTDKQAERYLFEPSLREIMVVFEKQIFAALMDQTVRESSLAKYASRMVSMDRASENIRKRLKLMEAKRQVLIREEQNRKQLNSIAALWAGRRN